MRITFWKHMAAVAAGAWFSLVFALPRAAADSITDWNDKAFTCTITARQAPFVATRTMAMVHIAMFDAVNAIEHGYVSYKARVAAVPSGSSADAAANAAAHAVLLRLFPDQRTTLDAAYAEGLARIPDGKEKTDGVEVGETVAAEIIV